MDLITIQRQKITTKIYKHVRFTYFYLLIINSMNLYIVLTNMKTIYMSVMNKSIPMIAIKHYSTTNISL